ncbi:hypothetical protein [Sporosarcina luteola]|uniref:hypothetical protein n=1 Tax=Sporosarcina luteola TaxID=582850 RepID=UPI00203F959F|nr:hypothetical protein [Sporosarcina luteola]MCM3709243.1 hypothetical protein [Sporosarcina luteola]
MEIDRYWECGSERLCVSFGIYAWMAAFMSVSALLCVIAEGYGLLETFMSLWANLCVFEGGAEFLLLNRKCESRGMVLAN